MRPHSDLKASTGDTTKRMVTWEEAGYHRPLDYDSTNMFHKIMFSFVSPLLERSKKQGLDVSDATVLSSTDRVASLVREYGYFDPSKNHTYGEVNKRKSNELLFAIMRAHRGSMLVQSFGVVLKSALRLLGPYALREFIGWIEDYDDANVETKERTGWFWASLLILFSVLQAVVHHQVFFVGMRLGFRMKQQAIAFVQEKLLRLNSAAFSSISTGQVVNLVSNDVRRFDEYGLVWPFVWAAPIETLIVLALIGREIGWVPAVAGLSTIMLLIPIQAKLAGRIAGLRAKAATRTDERVRITADRMKIPVQTWKNFIAKACLLVSGVFACLTKAATRINSKLHLSFKITPVRLELLGHSGHRNQISKSNCSHATESGTVLNRD